MLLPLLPGVFRDLEKERDDVGTITWMPGVWQYGSRRSVE